ncbi:hypothetical protein EDD85DRAFT_795286 [Armillaria nabsnona]|nr:hypothetical protein EDD85DRAFT_795286 [Armillaria nabsnona]
MSSELSALETGFEACTAWNIIAKPGAIGPKLMSFYSRSNSGTKIRRRAPATAAVSHFKTMGRRGVIRVFVGCKNGCRAEVDVFIFAEMKYTYYVRLKISVLFLSLSRSIPRGGDVPGICFLGLETNLWVPRTTLERPNTASKWPEACLCSSFDTWKCMRKFEGAGCSKARTTLDGPTTCTMSGMSLHLTWIKATILSVTIGGGNSVSVLFVDSVQIAEQHTELTGSCGDD